MTLPTALEVSVTQLRAKHTALIEAVNRYRSGTIDVSKQDILNLASGMEAQLAVEEKTLLGQLARKGRMPSLLLDYEAGYYGEGTNRLETVSANLVLEEEVPLGNWYRVNGGTLVVEATAPVGTVLAILGSLEVLSDSEERKAYTVTCTEEVGAGVLVVGPVHRLMYYPWVFV